MPPENGPAPGGEGKGAADPLAPYLDTPLKLFVADPVMRKQLAAALAGLGFSQLIPVKVPPDYFSAMRRLFGELKGFEGLVLVNHPPRRRKDASGVAYQDYAFNDFYGGVASLGKGGRRPLWELMSKCLPVFIAAQDRDIRQRTIEDLFPFGITAAFMLDVLPLGLSDSEQVDERRGQLADYLVEFFLHREQKLRELAEYSSAEELRQARVQAEELMAEAARLKQAGNYEKAIALCRRVTEILPRNVEAYLEGGRLLVKRKKYPPAMQMFRDAERVAEEQPAPNREIANCRVAQVKDYVVSQRAAGMVVDPGKVDAWLAEAVNNFGVALAKAEVMPALRSADRADRRRDAAAEIAENMLTLELEELLGEDHPRLVELGSLAQKTLVHQVKGNEELSSKYLVQFGLLAFQQGDLAGAERYLLQAAGLEETYDQACRKLNFIGTQLRQRGRVEEAIEIYHKLLNLEPGFRGVVLYNMATAQMIMSSDLKETNPPESQKWRQKALATAVTALYVDPKLTREDNFYANTAMAPLLRQACGLFAGAVAAAADPAGSTAGACRQAREKLEDLLARGQEKQALSLLFSLAGKLKPFFLEFDKHASEPIREFAQRLLPLLSGHAKPKMRVFGRILKVLVDRSRQAGRADAGSDPRLQAVYRRLERAEQALAAGEMAHALASGGPDLGRVIFSGDKTLQNLCREMSAKLAGVDLSRFPEDA